MGLKSFVIRKDNGSNKSLFLSCQMGLSDGAFFMIKHTPLPNGNHPILSPVCPMGVADTLELCISCEEGFFIYLEKKECSFKKDFTVSRFIPKKPSRLRRKEDYNVLRTIHSAVVFVKILLKTLLSLNL